MADSTNISDFLYNQMFNTAQVNAAKVGGYGGGGLPQIFGSLLQAGAAAFPNSPLLQFAGNMAQNANLRAYNREMVRQYNQAQQLAQQEKQGQRTDRVSKAQQLVGNVGDYQGYEAWTPQEIAARREVLANPDISNLNETGEFYMTNPYGAYGDTPGNMQKRAWDVMDAQETEERRPKYFANSLIGQPIMNQMMQKLSNAGMDTSEMGLSAGVTKRDPITPAMAGTMAKPDISELFKFRKNEQDNVNTQFSNNTTRQHYERSDATAKNELDAKKAGIGYFKKYPPSGGSGNPYTIPNAAQNFAQGQIDAIDKELKTLGYIGKGGQINKVKQNGAGFFGLGGYQQTAADQRAQQLIEMRNELQKQILPAFGSTFGNQSGRNLKQAASSLAQQSRSIYPGRQS